MLPIRSGPPTSTRPAPTMRPVLGQVASAGILYLAMFLLTFGPRLYGIVFLDMITLTSFAVLVFVASTTTWARMARNLPRFTTWAMVLSALWAASGFLLNGLTEPFHLYRSLRALLNFSAMFALCWYVHWTDQTRAQHRLLDAMFWSVATHSALMCLQYFYPPSQSYLYELSGMFHQKATRVTGLTTSYNTLAIVNGFGFILGVLLLAERSYGAKKTIVAYVGLAVILISLMLAGRTAAYLTGVVVVFCLAKVAGSARTLAHAFAFAVFLTVVVATLWTVSSIDTIDRFENTTLRMLSEPIRAVWHGDTLEGTHTARTLDTIRDDMYFLPNDMLTLLVGTGGDGRTGTYVASDSGYVLHIFGTGVVGMSLMVAVYLNAMFSAMRRGTRGTSAGFLLFWFALGCLILNGKEQVLLTRHGLTMLSLLLSLAVLRPSPRGRPGRDVRLPRRPLRPVGRGVLQDHPNGTLLQFS